jgi:hypothetical protein
MKKKLLDLLENHVDKLILGVIAIASLAVLWFFVIGSPYGAMYARKKYGPGKIDAKIKESSQRIEQRIDGEATVEFRKYKGNKAVQVSRSISGSINIRDGVGYQIPGVKKGLTEDKRFYRKPAIGIVEGVDAELIRTTVFVPTEKVDMTLSYEQAEAEVDDIDFVTIQGSFDAASLYRNFKKSFVDSVADEYKDQELAIPVFASVCLERQVLDESGQWSDWQRVDRPDIDRRREMFVLPEKAKDVELGGINLLIVNFDEFEVQKDLLQPVAYDIAASNAEWMTPTYHKELEKLIAKEAKEEEIKASGRGRPKKRDPRKKPMGGDGYGMGDGGGAKTVRGRKPKTRKPSTAAARRDRTMEDIREDFEFVMLTEEVDMEVMKEPLVIWGFDDDLKPFGTYRYRMRVGVFNPTAGKGWFSGVSAEFKDDVVLWSDYSEVTDEISIDPMVHLFPLEVARGKKAATIQVAKFHDGKWQSQEFDVRIGESIGGEVEVQEEDEKGRPSRRRNAEDIKTIDFSSGAILVDIVESRRSSSVGRPYQEILYSEDGSDIKRLGVSKRGWSKEMVSMSRDIADQEDFEVVISTTRGRTGGGIYRGGREGGIDEMGGFGPGGFGPGGFGPEGL